jgi:peptide/nickel transport system substrate-binding protein
MHGSGAYRLREWVDGQHILLEKKDKWWGSRITDGDNMFFNAYPDSVTYEVISDQTAALTALKAGQLDVMRSINARDFDDKMKGNAKVMQQFNLHEPPMLAYSALGMNMDSPIFSSRKTRQAMAYLTNYDRLIEDVMQDYGSRTVGPVFPTLEKYYNDTLVPYSFHPSTAKQLLTADGWRDADGDGFLEKFVEGKRLDFEFDFIVNKGQQERESVALILQEDLRKAGIKMNIQSLDWSVVVQKLQSHDFDMMYLSVVSDPAPEDYTQMWSTASQRGGYNFVNFGTARTDSLIQAINQTLDAEKRAHLVRQFQDIVHQEVPYIYLWNPINRMAISKHFTNTRVSAVRPGFWVPGFRLK